MLVCPLMPVRPVPRGEGEQHLGVTLCFGDVMVVHDTPDSLIVR